MHFHLCERADRACLPEVDPGGGRGTLGVPSALPVIDEVVPAAVAGVHPEHEIEQAVSPPPEFVITGGGPELAQKDTRTRSVVHAGDALHPTLACFEVLARRAGVDSDCPCAWPSCRQAPRQCRELPQHGAREATIALTSKSAAAIRQSAAP